VAIVVPTPNTTITSAWGKSVADQLNLVHELVYAQTVTAVGMVGVTAPTAVTLVAGPATTFDGAPVMVEFYAAQAQCGAGAGTAILFNLWDGGSDLGYYGQIINVAASILTVPVFLSRRLTPSAGSHTYIAKAWVPAGSGGSVGAGPGGINALPPMFLRVTRAT